MPDVSLIAIVALVAIVLIAAGLLGLVPGGLAFFRAYRSRTGDALDGGRTPGFLFPDQRDFFERADGFNRASLEQRRLAVRADPALRPVAPAPEPLASTPSIKPTEVVPEAPPAYIEPLIRAVPVLEDGEDEDVDDEPLDISKDAGNVVVPERQEGGDTNIEANPSDISAPHAIATPPDAPAADPDDLMALFAESAAKSVVPEALSEAYERVEINDLLNDVRSIKKLLGPSRK